MTKNRIPKKKRKNIINTEQMILLKMQVYTQEHGKTNHYKEQTLELFLTCSSVC